MVSSQEVRKQRKNPRTVKSNSSRLNICATFSPLRHDDDIALAVILQSLDIVREQMHSHSTKLNIPSYRLVLSR